MNSGDISKPAGGLSLGNIHVLLYVYRYWNTEHFCSHGLSIEVLIPYLIFVFCASVLVLFLSLEHLVAHSAYNFVKPIIGDHLRLMFYSSNLSLQGKLSILNIGLFILCVLINLAYREQNKDSMHEQITLSSNTTFLSRYNFRSYWRWQKYYSSS